MWPQPSDIVPHLAPAAAHVVGLHSHLLLLQTNGTLQLPQSSFPPQASSTIPHSTLRPVQVFAGQAHTFASPPPPHVRGALQLPQASIALQPSEIVPQFFPCAAHDLAVHPHWPTTPPPPQVAGGRQGRPQSSSLPQPSEAGPH
jgi:hypothetical protein